MTTLLALLPLLLVLGLLASGRVGALVAGLAGLSATLVASFVIVLQAAAAPCSVRCSSARRAAGAWLSWQVIAIIAAGMFFHRCMQARDGAGRSERHAATPAAAVVGLLPAGAVRRGGDGLRRRLHHRARRLRRLGIGGVPALVLGLYSQSLVPWGALATGTTVGATLAGLTPNQLGLGSALLQVPIHVFYLALYWRFAREAGVTVSPAQKIDDVAWTALLLGLVWLLNRYSDVEIAGAAPRRAARRCASGATSGPTSRASRRAHRQRALRRAHRRAVRHAPGAAAARSPEALVGAEAVRQPAGLRAVLRAGLLAGRRSAWSWCGRPRAPLGRVLAEAGRGAWRACLVTLLFVVMAEFYVGSGMAQSIAEALHAAAGRGAAPDVPLFAARRRLPDRRRAAAKPC